MIKVDGYKAFRGIMRITERRLGKTPYIYDIEGHWLYDPKKEQCANRRSHKEILQEKIKELNNKVEIEKSLRKIGKSFGIIVDSIILEASGISKDDKITISIKKDLITIRKQKEKE
jgi:hypothetical protein